jgi:hypothetical protein
MVEPRVETVGERAIEDPKTTAKRNQRLWPVFGKRIQQAARPTAQDKGKSFRRQRISCIHRWNAVEVSNHFLGILADNHIRGYSKNYGLREKLILTSDY